MTAHSVMCDQACGRQGKRHVRLDPRNYAERRAILCPKCAARLGYSPWQPGRANYAPERFAQK